MGVICATPDELRWSISIQATGGTNMATGQRLIGRGAPVAIVTRAFASIVIEGTILMAAYTTLIISIRMVWMHRAKRLTAKNATTEKSFATAVIPPTGGCRCGIRRLPGKSITVRRLDETPNHAPHAMTRPIRPAPEAAVIMMPTVSRGPIPAVTKPAAL
jgi:hypothetical protein